MNSVMVGGFWDSLSVWVPAVSVGLSLGVLALMLTSGL